MFDVFINDPIALTLLAGVILLLSIGLAVAGIKRFEFAILLMIISPWISVLFTPSRSELLQVEQVATFGSYLRISVLLLVGLVGIISFFRFHRQHNRTIPLQYILLGVFSLMALISTFYSIDQKMTFIRSVSFIFFFFFLLGLGSWLDSEQKIQNTLNMVFWVLSAFMFLNLIALPLLTQRVWAFETSRFQGLWSHPNTMGGLCMISYPIFIWKYFDCNSNLKWFVILLIILTIAMHILTGSRTTLLSSVLGTFIFLFIVRKGFSNVFSLILLLLLLSGFIIINPSSFSRRQGQAVTDLSGRLEIWGAALQLSQERPLLGYGYAVGGKGFEDPRFFRKGESLWVGSSRVSLHNGYLSIAIGVGLIGLVIYFFLLLLPFFKSFKIPDIEIRGLIISFFLMCLAANFTESYIVGPSNLGAVVLWILWVIAGEKTIDAGAHIIS